MKITHPAQLAPPVPAPPSYASHALSHQVTSRTERPIILEISNSSDNAPQPIPSRLRPACFAGATVLYQAPGGSHPAVVVRHLGGLWRVKSCPYANHVVAGEVAMANTFALLGLNCPATLLVEGCPMEQAKTPGPAAGAELLQVASQWVEQYQDLGVFLRCAEPAP